MHMTNRLFRSKKYPKATRPFAKFLLSFVPDRAACSTRAKRLAKPPIPYTLGNLLVYPSYNWCLSQTEKGT